MKNNVKLIGLFLIVVIMCVCIAGCTDISSNSPDVPSSGFSSSGLVGIPDSCKYENIGTTTMVYSNTTFDLTGRLIACKNENINYVEVKAKWNNELYWVRENAL